MLASELSLPLNQIPTFIEKAKKLGRKFGVNIATEAIIINRHEAMTISAFLCDGRNSSKYLVQLLLVPMLTRLGIKFKGRPYGIGIWNTPFVKQKLGKKFFKEAKRFKKKKDPAKIFNPGKFFSLRTSFFNLPGLLFKPFVFNPLMDLLLFSSPLWGWFSSFFTGRKKEETSEFHQVPWQCARCNSCLSTCPAYLVTRDERISPKNKLTLLKKILQQETITPETGSLAFLCLHCHLCEKICQSQLKLVSCWEELEKRLEKKFPRPAELIADFIKQVENSDEYWAMLDKIP
jgi:ferredoxin